jgi:predicted branched-subunit amino acid permease
VTAVARPPSIAPAVARTRLTTEVRGGAVAMLPLLAGVAPIGLLVGATIADHSNTAASLAGTWLIYGASAHLAFMQLTGAGTDTALVVITCVLINARLIVYSASMAAHWRDESTGFKALASAAIVDPSFALADARYRRPGSTADKRAFYVGAATTLWIGWTVLVVGGMAVGGRFGQPRVLALALPLCLFVMIAPSLVNRPVLAGVVTAGTVALFADQLPSGAGLLAAIVAGAVAGAIAEGRSR